MNGIPLRKIAVACALALSGTAAAQQEPDVAPGLYARTIESETYLEKGSRSVDLPKGEAGFADNEALQNLDVIPSFLTNDRTPAPGTTGFVDCGVYAGSSAPLSDQPLQSDFDRYDREILGEIDRFLEEGYPPASVLMHAASQGIAIDRAVYAAVRSQPLRTNELYMAALELMAFLPGWTCSSDVNQGLYDTVYDVNDLSDQRLVQEVAERFFSERARLAQYPDWPHDEFHMLASTDELLQLLSRLETEYWYRPGPRQEGAGAHPRDTVLIGLYPDNEQIVVDTAAKRIREWRDQGRERVPVTFFYNFEHQWPVSRFSDDATLEDIMNAFFSEGLELTPVPLWTAGDYHLMVSGEELEALFELPESGDIDPQRYRELADDLDASGFSNKPVLVTLLSSGGYHRVAGAERVRVAMDQGIEEFPVVLFYHRLGRQSCGSAAVCFESLCDALVCAGGDPNACLDPAAAGAVRDASFEAPTGGGGGSPPPPEPPPPPPPASPS